ncbi:MAG: tRNA (N6-threonylcarbamoyladenosine(37)-N6)-methyltransferase TrmO [Proteobacteria bacterium]|nr:tRNA (N6-threonylcarbamoyladenosine(37)-N6)-methyltransferase TrmO [Pseudomonadota bacterium]
MEITYQPIGIIHSPFKTIKGMPIQPSGAESIKGKVEIYQEFIEGLKDLDGFSHIILIYHFHKVAESKLTVIPFLDSKPHGVFSTRAPLRPNHIGLSIVKLLKIENNSLHIENVDILDGTPLLDIKPYVPEFDSCKVTSVGWLEKAKEQVKNHKSDDRFNK